MPEAKLAASSCQEESYDKYLSRGIQTCLEQRYHAKIAAHAQLEQLLHDPLFFAKPEEHSSLYADHGIVHARDVARQILQVLDCANGVLIPARDPGRLEFMKGYGILLAFIHDIGLYDLSAFGRKMHAHVVTQMALSPEFDDLVQAIWDENSANIPRDLTKQSHLKADPRLVLREMLALAVCHSKSSVPVALLSNPQKLRKAMLCFTAIDLHVLYDRIYESSSTNRTSTGNGNVDTLLESDWLDTKTSPERVISLRQYYRDFPEEGFRWLVDEHPLVRQLAEDVTDTLRALRCADALRQRGTTLKTSGSYEIFVDRKTGNAIFALRRGDQDLILVETPDPVSAGEANLASCEITADGDLRASFHRGSFPSAATIQKAASNAALVLGDIYKDIIQSFQRLPPSGGSQKEWLKDANEMQILLENVGDNPEFASLIQRHFQQSNPAIQNPVRVVPSLKDVSERERRLYMEAKELEWDDEARREALERIAKSGHKTSPIDPHLAFQDVKQVKIHAGATLIEAGAQPGFVYIPLSGSLKVMPLGGYPPFSLRPWMPLGITAVIRGSVRNATVVAEDDVTLLMIPQEIYLEYWHHTYDLNEFVRWMEAERAKQAGKSGGL